MCLYVLHLILLTCGLRCGCSKLSYSFKFEFKVGLFPFVFFLIRYCTCAVHIMLYTYRTYIYLRIFECYLSLNGERKKHWTIHTRRIAYLNTFVWYDVCWRVQMQSILFIWLSGCFHFKYMASVRVTSDLLSAAIVVCRYKRWCCIYAANRFFGWEINTNATLQYWIQI